MLPPSSIPDDAARSTRIQARLFWSACLLVGCSLVLTTAGSLFAFEFFPFLFALQMSLALWGPYALAAPGVFWFARRYPIDRATWRRAIPLHMAASLLFVALCEGGFAASIRTLEPRAFAILSERSSQTAQNAGIPNPILRTFPTTRDESPAFPGASLRLTVFKMQFSLPLYWVLVGVAHALGGIEALRERERQTAQLAAHLTRAQLAGLRTQLQPHFLFNTLNSITALIPENPRLATEMVMNLSDLLRMTLRDPQQGDIPLEEELALLRHYVDIQRLRFGDRLNFHLDVGEDSLRVPVPPLLLQPLVENAIRHGVEASEHPETVTVAGRIRAGVLHLDVSNTFHPPTEESPQPAKSTGLGLANSRARLQVRHGDRQHFEAGRTEDGGFRVSLRIPVPPDGETPSPHSP